MTKVSPVVGAATSFVAPWMARPFVVNAARLSSPSTCDTALDKDASPLRTSSFVARRSELLSAASPRPNCVLPPTRNHTPRVISRYPCPTLDAGHALATRPMAQLGSPSTQIGRPKTSIKKDVGRATPQEAEPQADAERGSAKARPRRKTLEDEMPMFKVILLADESYVESHVVTQLQKTIQISKGDASRFFHEAQSTGSSVVCVVCEEHAEFYAQQLKRQDIYAIVEKDE